MWKTRARGLLMLPPERSKGAKAVRKSEAKREAAGAVRMPNGWLTPEADHALGKLIRQKYAPTRTGAICRALVEALKCR